MEQRNHMLNISGGNNYDSLHALCQPFEESERPRCKDRVQKLQTVNACRMSKQIQDVKEN